VLPFVNMSADPDQEYFSDGLSEELLNVLAKIDDLRVISRTSAFAFKGKEISLPEIARQLDVSYVLEGSVRSAGDQVRITAQLIEVDSDSHLWSEAYNRKLENVFEIQEEISQAIARELQVELGAGPVADRPTESLAAYQLFLRGRHHYQARREENMQLAVDSLTQAVTLDPGFADAWANLAAASAVLSFYLAEDFVPARQEAERAARRAIELDAGNGFARAVLGLLLSAQLEFEAAVRELERAIELSPSESNSYLWMGITLSELGYIEQAIDYLERAERFDPVFVNLQNWLSGLHATAGDMEKYRLHQERSSRLNPQFGTNLPGAVEFMRGDIEGAYAAYVKNVEVSGGDLVAADYMFAALRDPGKRAESAELLLEHASRNDLWGGVFSELWHIGAVEEAVDHWWDMRAAGRTLRATSSLASVWVPWLRRYLSHPATLRLFREAGLVDYWRAHGNPDYCRVLENDDIECDSP
jgi:TolB-like protein/Tfp pilus assembly protein PilF